MYNVVRKLFVFDNFDAAVVVFILNGYFSVKRWNIQRQLLNVENNEQLTELLTVIKGTSYWANICVSVLTFYCLVCCLYSTLKD